MEWVLSVLEGGKRVRGGREPTISALGKSHTMQLKFPDSEVVIVDDLSRVKTAIILLNEASTGVHVILLYLPYNLIMWPVECVLPYPQALPCV